MPNLSVSRFLFSPIQPKVWLMQSYFTFFMGWGILIPFWAVWLEGLHFDSRQIGNMVAISLIARSLGSLIFPLLLKEAKQLIPSLKLLGFLCLLTTSGFWILSDFFTPTWFLILCLMVILNFFVSPPIPLTDSLASEWQKQSSFQYGRVRLWGSIGFVVGSSLVGYLIDVFDYQVIIYTMICAQMLFLFSTFRIPTIQPQSSQQGVNKPVDIKKLFFSPMMILIMLAIMLLQGSHAAYYTFAAPYWKSLGYSGTTTGFLVAFAVVAEIFFFAFGNKIVARMQIRHILQISAVATILRWVLMANVTSWPMILFTQSFHAITYVMGHMAIVRFIASYKEQEVIYLQAVYATMASGVGIAMFTSISGILIDRYHADAFYFMSGVALVGLLLIPRRITANHES